MCCGQKRTELQNSQTRRTVASVPRSGSANNPPRPGAAQTSLLPAAQKASPHPPANTTTFTPQAGSSVRYLDKSPIRVRGLVTGMSYEFSGSHPVQQVDTRDAASLLNTRFFRRA